MKHYWAIKHRPTGFFLPSPHGKQGRGGSHVEPVDPTKEYPRLFTSHLGARRCLSSWLQGRHTAKIGYDYDEYSGNSYSYQESTLITPAPERKREDMAVVPIYMMTSSTRPPYITTPRHWQPVHTLPDKVFVLLLMGDGSEELFYCQRGKETMHGARPVQGLSPYAVYWAELP